ncbi:MAG TPA: hypothetical protein VIM73_11605 [Polyangiaceae bacterium]
MKSTSVVFAVTAVVSSVIGVAAVSHAITDVRASGFDCAVVNGPQATLFVNTGNDSTAATLNVARPVPDVYNGIQGISTTRVDSIDRSTTASVSASRCVNLRFPNGAVGTSCGPSVTAPNNLTGHLPLSPVANADWLPGLYGYLSVFLPPRTGLGRSTVQGIHAF